MRMNLQDRLQQLLKIAETKAAQVNAIFHVIDRVTDVICRLNEVR
jgi:hypothetical protein